MARLKIHFGGLCLMAQRTTAGNEGLWVLMPTDWVHGHTPQYSTDGKTFQPLPQPQDLAPANLSGGSAPQAFDNAFHFTKELGASVRAELFDKKMPETLVAARFRLPFPVAKPQSHPNIARVKIGTGGQTIEVTGIVSVEYDFTKEVKIGPVTIPAGANAEVHFANMIPGSGNQTHAKGEKLMHIGHYYYLLKDFPKPPPDVFVADPYKGVVSISYIDPVQCTIGTGCPEDEPDCGWG